MEAAAAHQRTTRQLLADFLLADRERALAASRILGAEDRWRLAIDVAQEWKVLPCLLARIQTFAVELTQADNATVKRGFLRDSVFSSARATGAIVAIRILEEAGIRVAAIKGIAAIAVLYGDPKHRTIQDADLLIRREDLFNAVALLERNGFFRKSAASLDEYAKFVENAPGFAGNEAVSLLYGKVCEIDLHWELSGSGLRTADILNRLVRANLKGADVPVADAADSMLLAIHHAIRENLAIETICRDLVDVRKWCDRLNSERRIDAVVNQCVEANCQTAVLGVLNLLYAYDKTQGVAELVSSLRSLTDHTEDRSAKCLQELFQYQLRNGRLGKDVFYLVHSRPWRQILKGLSRNWSAYWRNLQVIEEELHEEKPLRRRIFGLVRSIPGFRGLKLARGLARIKYGKRTEKVKTNRFTRT